MSLTLNNKEIEYTKEELFIILHEYIREQLELSRRKMLDEDNFGKPAWSEYQAYQLGFQKALTKLDSFIPMTPEGIKT